jgi:hypothetical protein
LRACAFVSCRGLPLVLAVEHVDHQGWKLPLGGYATSVRGCRLVGLGLVLAGGL